jgi:anti-sigma factor (TIGR02949 family)
MKVVNIGSQDCKRVLALLDFYLSNELTVETAGEVVAHLERCPHCLELFRIRDLVRKRLRAALLNEEVSPEMRKRVSRVLRKASGSWLSRAFQWRQESSND